MIMAKEAPHTVDLDAPLRMILEMLAREYSAKDVAVAAFEALGSEDAKELISRISDEPERPYYEITPEDVGKSSIIAWGRKWSVSNLMGTIYKVDVGKRITRTTLDNSGTLQVENNQQRETRLAMDRMTQTMRVHIDHMLDRLAD